MTTDEFVAIRETLGLTPSEMAARMGLACAPCAMVSAAERLSCRYEELRPPIAIVVERDGRLRLHRSRANRVSPYPWLDSRSDGANTARCAA